MLHFYMRSEGGWLRRFVERLEVGLSESIGLIMYEGDASMLRCIRKGAGH